MTRTQNPNTQQLFKSGWAVVSLRHMRMVSKCYSTEIEAQSECDRLKQNVLGPAGAVLMEVCQVDYTIHMHLSECERMARTSMAQTLADPLLTKKNKA